MGLHRGFLSEQYAPHGGTGKQQATDEQNQGPLYSFEILAGESHYCSLGYNG